MSNSVNPGIGTGAMEISEHEVDLLCQTISKVFDNREIERLVHQLGKDLSRIVNTRQPRDGVAFDLVLLSRRQGWTKSLIRALYVSRIGDPNVKKLVEQTWPSAVVAEKATEYVNSDGAALFENLIEVNAYRQAALKHYRGLKLKDVDAAASVCPRLRQGFDNPIGRKGTDPSAPAA